LQPGQSATLQFVGTACSVAWLDAIDGGVLNATIDGNKEWSQPTNVPFKLASGESTFMENRKGILNLPFGVHQLEVQATDKPVTLLGAFSYDTRSNQKAQRTLQGIANPGDSITFSASFNATPLVFCSGGLKVLSASATQITFAGDATGSYQIIGE
jgi:hypothetical protein